MLPTFAASWAMIRAISCVQLKFTWQVGSAFLRPPLPSPSRLPGAGGGSGVTDGRPLAWPRRASVELVRHGFALETAHRAASGEVGRMGSRLPRGYWLQSRIAALGP